MADNYAIRDGDGAPVTMKSKDTGGGVQAVQSIPSNAAGTAYSSSNPLPVTSLQLPVALDTGSFKVKVQAGSDVVGYIHLVDSGAAEYGNANPIPVNIIAALAQLPAALDTGSLKVKVQAGSDLMGYIRFLDSGSAEYTNANPFLTAKAGAAFADASLSATLGTSSASALATSAGRKTAFFHNCNTAARVAIHLTGGTAVVDGVGCVTLNPGDSLPIEGRGATGAFTAIASSASSSLTIVTT